MGVRGEPGGGASFSAEGALGQELLEFGFAHSAQIVVSGHQAPLF